VKSASPILFDFCSPNSDLKTSETCHSSLQYSSIYHRYTTTRDLASPQNSSSSMGYFLFFFLTAWSMAPLRMNGR
jgi:hypothetical protein